MTQIAPRPARGALTAVCSLVVFVTFGCGPVSPPGPTQPETPAATAETTASPDLVRLIALVGRPDDLGLVRIVDGSPASLVLPPGRAAWISGDSTRGLVLTDRDGTLHIAGSFGGHGVVGPQPAWTRLRPLVAIGAKVRHPLSFATLSPDGSRIAAIADDAAEGGRLGQLVVIEVKSAAAVVFDLDETTDGRSPDWLGVDEILVPTRDRSDRNDISVIHPTTGERSRWSLPTGALATAAGARALAIQERDGGRVAVGPADEVANGRPVPVVNGSEPGAVAAQMVLDGAGVRLAVAWLDDAGDTRILAVYERRADSWTVVRRDVLPAATNRAILAGFDE
jgi:hypothetical protein